MTVLTVSEVLLLHEKLIVKTGGLNGIRDMGLLESAILNCSQTFDDEELYPTTTEKAARIAFGICKNHPFLDGNKRVAILSMLMMLQINDMPIRYTQKELINLGLGIADGTIDDKGILSWINQHAEENQ